MGEVQHQVCLLLGSNIQPERNLPLAVRELPLAGQEGEQMSILQASSVWESPAVGSHGPDFLNAALLCQTWLAAEGAQVSAAPWKRLGECATSDQKYATPIGYDIITVDGRLYDPLL
jgi:hypothetical protein